MAPGTGAPTHRHAVEEILTVVSGEAEVWLGAERARLAGGQTLLVPAGAAHGFTNAGAGTLHVRAVLASRGLRGLLRRRGRAGAAVAPPAGDVRRAAGAAP